MTDSTLKMTNEKAEPALIDKVVAIFLVTFTLCAGLFLSAVVLAFTLMMTPVMAMLVWLAKRQPSSSTAEVEASSQAVRPQAF